MTMTVEIENKQALVIRLPLDMLDTVVSACPALYDGVSDRGPRVLDAPLFASEVLRALEAELEDGTTLVHRMFDAALTQAIEDGAEGVELPE